MGDGGFSISSSTGPDGLRIGIATRTGRCCECSSAAIIRYTFAVAAYEQDVLFVLEDIAVPSF
jgi:hypothetical protein